MGGYPRSLFIAVAIPGTISIAFMDELYRGMKHLAAAHDVNILGGDTTKSLSHLVIAVTIVGEAPAAHVKLRSSARPGDWIGVTGTLGDARMGLHILRQGTGASPLQETRSEGMVLHKETGVAQPAGKEAPESLRETLVRRFLEPRPYINEGLFLGEQPAVHAMIDLSDGLASDIRHICGQSRCGAVIDTESVPISDEVRQYGAITGLDPVSEALSGGEDYRLLFTVDAASASTIGKAYRERFNEEIRFIGKITQGEGVFTRQRDGRVSPLAEKGFDHFSSADESGEK
jgi:thiamine-monophosphate kinase